MKQILYTFVVKSKFAMLTFNEITLGDKEAIKSRLTANRCRCSDFSFANLVCWAPRFHSQFAVVDDNVFFKFIDYTGNPCYTMPLGSMAVKDRINAIMTDADFQKKEFVMRGVTVKMWEQLDTNFPGKFEYASDRDNYEYIYESERLISLAGKKLQKKRNHINKFKLENPDWFYEKISSEQQLEECLNMLCKWDNIEHNDKHQSYDYIASELMIKDFFELNLVGGLIKVKNEIVAFSIASELTDDTLCVHLEKAFADINGAYTIINQQLAEHEGKYYKYINREEDMGIEGLRKAKLSYYPDILLKEGVVRLK